MARVDVGKAKFKFIVSLIFLAAGFVYSIFPLDLIPDILGPVGWIDDIGILAMTALYAGISYWRMKKEQARAQKMTGENILP